MRLRRLGALAAAVSIALCGAAAAAAAAAAGAGAERPATVPAPLDLLPSGVLSPINTIAWPHGKPIGWVLLVHGGGWMMTGSVWSRRAGWYTRHGWGTYAIDYRHGLASLSDTVAAYDWLRRRHPRVPICAEGSSSGGWEVMMLAVLRPDLACAVAQAGPTDLRSWASQEPTPELREWVGDMLDYTFTPRLWEFSPVRLAGYIRCPLVLATARFDRSVPPAQMQEMKRRRRQTITLLLARSATPSGRAENFAHATVTPAAMARFNHTVEGVLRAVAGRAAAGRATSR